ncbi:MAG TPA: hypothetical protein VN700_14780 [Vicinamibacterales bacterium]|nr:hypothetical protein [Vicinamibacterales bacterium]
MKRLRGLLVPAIVFVVLAGLAAHGTNAATGDPVHYMVAARSVAFDRDLDLTNDYGDPGNILQPEPGQHAVPGRNGELRPVHDVGMPILLAPAFGIAYRLAEWTQSWPESFRKRTKLSPFIALRQFVSLIMIALTAWAAALFLKAGRKLAGDDRRLTWCALAWALSPPILTHGYVFFTEVPSAIVALLCYLRRDDVSGPRWRWHGMLLGALTGLLVLLHVRNVGLVLAFVGLTIWRVRREPRRLAGYAAGLGLMAVLKIFQNYAFWGTFVTTPHEQFGQWPGLLPALGEAALRGGAMLFDGAHGLLLSAPIYLLAPAAFVMLFRRSRPVAVELGLLCAAYLLFVMLPVTNIHGWHGGWAPAARFLVPISPFLALPVALFVTAGQARWLAGVIVAVQVLISQYVWAHPMWSWSGDAEPSAWLVRLVGESAASRIPIWPIVRPFDASSWMALAAGATIVLCVTWMLLREPRSLKT